MNDIARIDRMEVVVARHDELIDRCVQAMEQQIKIDERLANHLEETKRQWTLLDGHSLRLEEMNQQVAEMLAFYKLARKVGWGVLGVLSGGLLYFVRFWAERHGS